MKKVILIIAILFLIGALAFLTVRNQSGRPTVAINGQTYFIEIADTAASQQHGLSDRLSLPQDHGMLFIFPEKQVRSFWMQDMQFPLDIIWIDGDTIVDISENIPPPAVDEQPAIVYPKAPVDKVLEVNAGEVKRLSVSVDQKIITDL
ncbi:MAG: hypothetical protein UV59_C0017G0022 [Candidatus Gottesmanbacteria bacterium GW2011_GWA1_43_11]|uniref:DUF192 domain-containing protein n=1 Tax=Candidatus Gottesmanbacteria bacterium GW2011_GWA1_43_11 TaxID=1618436 RepID=A0A0G1CGF3_9BACT|nr:MAG: hypothetical protein UV59_C0017G0022 [Candidatus Gottesmanbacteria bacterium GW2011_GWA1_43_11]